MQLQSHAVENALLKVKELSNLYRIANKALVHPPLHSADSGPLLLFGYCQDLFFFTRNSNTSN